MNFELMTLKNETGWGCGRYFIRECDWTQSGPVFIPDHHFEAYFGGRHLVPWEKHYHTIDRAMRACEKHYKENC